MMFFRSVCIAVLLMALALPRLPAQIETTTAAAETAVSTLAVALPGLAQNEASCECPTGMVAECTESSLIVSRSLSNGNNGAQCHCRSDSGPLDRVCLQPERDCSCTRERDPQCNTDGLEVAANSCVAECYGYRKADANLWNCKILPEAFRDDYFSTWDASIKQEYECKEKCRAAGLRPSGPLCDATGAMVAESACLASCEGRDPMLLSRENCASTSSSPSSSSTDDCLSTCNSRDTSSGPVCDSKGAPVADSECAALCLGYEGSHLSTSTCAPYFRDSVLCGCDAPESEDDAVCNAQGTRITGSACLATCLGYSSSDVNKANCGAERGKCICPLIYDPLCDDKGTILAANTCDANCEYGSEAEVAALMSKGNCDGTTLRHDNAACGCAGTEAAAVCDALGTEVAPSSCVASCAGYRDYVLCSNWKPSSPSSSSSSTRTSPEADKLVPFTAPDVGSEATNNNKSISNDDNVEKEDTRDGSINSTVPFPGTEDPDDDESAAFTKRANIAWVLLLSLQSVVAAAALLEFVVAP